MVKSVQIVLVHGTWGRGLFSLDEVAAWCRPHSTFVEKLTRRLAQGDIEAAISVHNWTGANSIIARSEAADQLAKTLAQTKDDKPSFIIGHSHGGNVALLATNRSRDPSRHHLVTLATPFLRVIPATKDTTTFEIVLNALFSVSLSFLVGVLCWRLSFLVEFGVGAIALSVIACLASLYLGRNIGQAVFRLTVNPPPPDLTRATHFQLKPYRLAEATNYNAASLGDRLLIVRGVDDEAALTLAFGAIANRLAWAIHRFIFAFLISLTGLAAPILSYIFPKPAPHQRWDCSVVTNGFCKDLGEVVSVPAASFSIGEYASMINFAVLLLGTFILFAPSLFRLVFGREMLTGTGQCDVSADAVPDLHGGATVHTIQEATVKRKLVHSIYDSDECPMLVAKWISNAVTSAPDTSIPPQQDRC